jgi:hypothetical protein
MTTTTTYLSGYKGSKIHAVNVTFEQWQRGWMDARTLCGVSNATVSDLPFKPNGLTCSRCAKAAQR